MVIVTMMPMMMIVIIIMMIMILIALSIIPPLFMQAYQTEITTCHNQYRSDINKGIAALKWSNDLASGAQQWADYLSSSNKFEHSGNANTGENIWMGSPGASPTSMVQAWGAEKIFFKYGIFPDVSTTGNWMDVGHYTQIIWRNTTDVGCGSASGSDGMDRFVCRYSPPGNFIGSPVY